MILTITLNPSVDVEYIIHETLMQAARLDLVRARRANRSAAGKGLNMARVLATLGVPVSAAYVLGLIDPKSPFALFKSKPVANLKVIPIQIPALGAPRQNIVIRCTNNPAIKSARSLRGNQIKINEPGPRWPAGTWKSVAATLKDQLRGTRWVVLSGSLPPGAPPAAYAELTRAAHRAGARVAIDAAGEPLRRALAARPDVVKINRAELRETIAEFETTSTAHAARDWLLARGAQCAVITDGPRVIHILSSSGERLRIKPEPMLTRQTTGAGDAFMAALVAMIDRGAPLDAAAKTAAKVGAQWIKSTSL